MHVIYSQQRVKVPSHVSLAFKFNIQDAILFLKI